MSRVNAYAPVADSHIAAPDAPEKSEDCKPIQEAIGMLRDALRRLGEQTVPQHSPGKPGTGRKINIKPVLGSLDQLEAATRRFLILPENQKTGAEKLNHLRKSVEKITLALQLSLHDEHSEAAATMFAQALQLAMQDEAATAMFTQAVDELSVQETHRLAAAAVLLQAFANQEKLKDEINGQIPDESTMLHIRMAGQIALLIIGIGSFFALNVLSLGLPILAIVGISLLPIVAGAIWNRAYDVCTTPCRIWKPMLDVVGKINVSLEEVNVFAMTVINRLEPQIRMLEPQIRRLEPRIEQAESQVRNLETKVAAVQSEVVSKVAAVQGEMASKVAAIHDEVASEISDLRNRVEVLLEGNQRLAEGNQRLAEDNQKMLTLLAQLLGSQAKESAKPATRRDAANDEVPALQIAQFG